jgi:hypothetical protein
MVDKEADQYTTTNALRVLMASSSSKTALKTFSLANDVLEVSQKDEIFEFDAAANRAVYNAAPWSKE